MKKVILFILSIILFGAQCFAQRTKDTLISGGVAVTATEAVPSMSANPIIDALLKIVVGVFSAIAAQFVSDFAKRRKERKKEEKFAKSIGAEIKKNSPSKN